MCNTKSTIDYNTVVAVVYDIKKKSDERQGLYYVYEATDQK